MEGGFGFTSYGIANQQQEAHVKHQKITAGLSLTAFTTNHNLIKSPRHMVTLCTLEQSVE